MLKKIKSESNINLFFIKLTAVIIINLFLNAKLYANTKINIQILDYDHNQLSNTSHNLQYYNSNLELMDEITVGSIDEFYELYQGYTLGTLSLKNHTDNLIDNTDLDYNIAFSNNNNDLNSYYLNYDLNYTLAALPTASAGALLYPAISSGLGYGLLIATGLAASYLVFQTLDGKKMSFFPSKYSAHKIDTDNELTQLTIEEPQKPEHFDKTYIRDLNKYHGFDDLMNKKDPNSPNKMLPIDYSQKKEASAQKTFKEDIEKNVSANLRTMIHQTTAQAYHGHSQDLPFPYANLSSFDEKEYQYHAKNLSSQKTPHKSSLSKETFKEIYPAMSVAFALDALLPIITNLIEYSLLSDDAHVHHVAYVNILAKLVSKKDISAKQILKFNKELLNKDKFSPLGLIYYSPLAHNLLDAHRKLLLIGQQMGLDKEKFNKLIDLMASMSQEQRVSYLSHMFQEHPPSTSDKKGLYTFSNKLMAASLKLRFITHSHMSILVKLINTNAEMISFFEQKMLRAQKNATIPTIDQFSQLSEDSKKILINNQKYFKFLHDLKRNLLNEKLKDNDSDEIKKALAVGKTVNDVVSRTFASSFKYVNLLSTAFD